MNHLPPPEPGGTVGHMHAVLDGLSPQKAMVALEHEFPGCHAHLSDGSVFAEVPGIGFGLHEPNAECMWQVLAAEVYRRHTRVLVSAVSAA